MNTKQEEFDAVVAHMYKQGEPSIKSGMCRYRTLRGDGTSLACAVGCRIPDEIYIPAMDVSGEETGTGLNNLIKNFGEVLPSEIKMYGSMFHELQNVHDTYWRDEGSFHGHISRELPKVALKHDVVFTQPDVSA